MKECIDCGKPVKYAVRCNGCAQRYHNKLNPRGKRKPFLELWIEKYGMEEGIEKWELYKAKLSANAKKRNENPEYKNPFKGMSQLKLLINKYGEEIGTQLHLDIKKSTSDKIKAKWEEEEYREKVIRGCSKPRPGNFKAEQSVRIKQWYVDNPNQRNIRSAHMKASWASGKIQPNITSCNHSVGEDNLREELRLRYTNLNVVKKTIRIGDKWFYPDILINDKLIIEYKGDYWHMNSTMFNENDIHPRTKVVAKDAWNNSEVRKSIFESADYNVLYIWESDIKNNYDATLFIIDEFVKQHFPEVAI